MQWQDDTPHEQATEQKQSILQVTWSLGPDLTKPEMYPKTYSEFCAKFFGTSSEDWQTGK